ncbi:DUF7305 domain-containing protein [Thermoanaerobacterium sp. DL9XJH110]|uniref:DUF7305 domain-containing protein n=1 Tax=Thermoanaerobacterium sp. DL9XJH110 TaxID=3386643 RepID=UPI003BB4C65B
MVHRFDNNLKNKKSQEGAVLVAVLFAVLVLMLLAVGILEMATGETKTASYYRDSTKAHYLAEAGIQKTLSMLKENPDYKAGAVWRGFLGKSHALGDGSYSVDITKLDFDTLEIRSTGFAGKSKSWLSVTADVSRTHPAFYNAVNVYSDLQDTQFKGSVEITGDVYVNGNLDLKGNAKIYGNVRATGQIRGEDNITGGAESFAEDIEPPPLDEHRYREMAGAGGGDDEAGEGEGKYIDGDLTGDEIVVDGVLFVDGDVYARSLSGKGVLFVTGDLHLTKGGVYSDTGEVLTIITKGDVDIKKQGNIDIDGTIYTPGRIFINHNEKIHGNIVIKGSILAGNFSASGNISVIYNGKIKDPGYYLPGSSDTYIKIISWKTQAGEDVY